MTQDMDEVNWLTKMWEEEWADGFSTIFSESLGKYCRWLRVLWQLEQEVKLGARNGENQDTVMSVRF